MKQQQKWDHIATKPENKKRFDFLKALLITREKPDVTQDELLVDMMDYYEKYKGKEKK